MNLLLHGIGAPEAESPITVDDSLQSQPCEHFEMVLTNPPFGSKSSITWSARAAKWSAKILPMSGTFWATTSNNQLNFLQHVKTLLTINGRAAIVVPDNVLFEGGAGRDDSRGSCWSECDVHTLLRLPHRDLLRGRGQGQRAVLRPQASVGEAVD